MKSFKFLVILFTTFKLFSMDQNSEELKPKIDITKFKRSIDYIMKSKNFNYLNEFLTDFLSKYNFEKDELKQLIKDYHLTYKKDKARKTLLHYAALSGNSFLVKMLLEEGANPLLVDLHEIKRLTKHNQNIYNNIYNALTEYGLKRTISEKT